MAKRHPKMITKAVNAFSALLAFNQEIGQAVTNFQNGGWVNDPKGALEAVFFKATGVTPSGSVDSAQLTASAVSKIGAYGFNKVAKFFLKRFRM